MTNHIAVVLTPGAIDSQVIVNGVDVSDACRAITIRAAVGEPTEITITLIGTVELIADVDHVVICHEPPR